MKHFSGAAEIVSPALEKWFRVRWLFSLGTLILLAPLITADFGSLFQQFLNICTTTMLAGAPTVLLAVLVLYFCADRADRRSMFRQVRPTIVVAAWALLLILFAIGDYLPFWPDALSLNGLSKGAWTNENGPSMGGALVSFFVLFPLFIWFCVFGVCSAYLVHNNTFNLPGSTITEPVINIALSWVVAAANLVLMAIAGIYYGIGTILLAVLGAAVATGISVWELRVLLASGATFRHGPWGIETKPHHESGPHPGIG